MQTKHTTAGKDSHTRHQKLCAVGQVTSFALVACGYLFGAKQACVLVWGNYFDDTHQSFLFTATGDNPSARAFETMYDCFIVQASN